MRNLKKLFAVILTVAMIASLMVPALAAVSYTSEGLALQQIGLIAGGADELKLDDSMTRLQGLAFTIRAAGKEDDAFAMTDAEVDAILADWTDADDIPSWSGNGRKYAAYAIKEKITVGISSTEKILAPNDPISGASFLVFLMISGMGYEVDTNPDSDKYVIDAAIDAGILNASQAVIYRTKAELIRDDAAGILFGAVMNGVNADGTKLIDALIASGDVVEADAIDAGFVEAVPDTLEALSATATNLKEIVVAFNTDLDADSATNVNNYSVADKTIKSVRLNEDGKSVTIELDEGADPDVMDNQSDFKVTVGTGVKSAAGVALAEDAELSGSVFDITIPVALSAEQTGPTTFKVRFSEPVVADADDFKVDNGTYFISGIASADNGYSVVVTLYATLPNGEHSVEVAGVEDYVPYKCVTKTLTFVAAKDEVAPAIARVISASPEKVELEMTEDVTLNKTLEDIRNDKDIYHTNSANIPDNVTADGKKVTLTFTTNKLPNGTAYLTIAKELFKDSWDNKNEEVKDLALTVTVDKVKPTVKSIESDDDHQIVIEFSEDITFDSDKFILLDATGKDVTDDNSFTVNYVQDDEGNDILSKVQLDFTDALSGSTYSVVIEGVKDLADNEIEKVSPTVAVTDTTAPEVTNPSEIYKNKKVIKVKFNEVMKSEDILNLANYQSNGIYLSTTKAKATIADGGKAVLIDYSKVTETLSETLITVGRVRDAAGNYTELFANTVDLTDVDAAGITIEKVEATGVKTLVVTLSDALTKFEKNDFVITDGLAIGVTFANNADGKGVITYTLDAELDTDLATPITVKTAAATASENSFGVKVKEDLPAVTADDKIPATFEAAFTSADAITITFSEKVDVTTLSKATFAVSGNTVTSIAITGDGGEDGYTIRMVLNLKDAVSTGSKVTVTQKVDFEDKLGNVSTGLEVKDVER